MLPEKAVDFIKAAEQDLSAMEDLRYFEFKSANAVCFHAQQYAEKIIKAKLIEMGIVPPRTHDLYTLLEYFDDSESIQRAREHCSILAQYEATTRYPYEGFVYNTPEEAEEAYNLTLEIPHLIGIYDSNENE